MDSSPRQVILRERENLNIKNIQQKTKHINLARRLNSSSRQLIPRYMMMIKDFYAYSIKKVDDNMMQIPISTIKIAAKVK